MNDFTKEELNILYHMTCADCDYIIRDVSKLSKTEGTELVREFYVGMLKQLHDMRLKIQSMIDNYRDANCVHQIDKTNNECKKCGLPTHSIPCNGGWL